MRRVLSTSRRAAVVIGIAATTLLANVGLTGPADAVRAAAASDPPPVTVGFFPVGPSGQQWTVPAGVTFVDYIVIGASNGSQFFTGYGARVRGRLTVTPFSVLDIWVGLRGAPIATGTPPPAGGWGGRNGSRHGGSGGGSEHGLAGGGGGGASEISLHNDPDPSNVLVIAGGGGGDGGNIDAFAANLCSEPQSGGCGAQPVSGLGFDGHAGTVSTPGGGGGNTAGGFAGGNGHVGEPKLTGGGGDGGVSSVDCTVACGGGGGGGGYGGGGGGAGGDVANKPGGGGSGRSAGTPGAVFDSGAPSRNGYIEITYNPPAAPPGTTRFVPLPPARLLDTRVAGDITGGQPLPASGGINLQVTGRGGVPASNVTAVVLNVTAAEALGVGFVTVWPTGQPRPQASNLNVTAIGQNIANLVTVRLGDNGMVSLYTQSGTHFVVDVEGYYEPAVGSVTAGRYMPLAPARILDTRLSIGVPGSLPVAANGQVDLLVAGHGGVPAAGASAVILNITAAEATAAGFVTVWPTGLARPEASTLNVTFAGQNIANLVIVPLGAGGKVSLYSQSGTHLVADVAGWFTNAGQLGDITGLFVPLAPARILDTRVAVGVTTTTPVAPNASIDVAIAGQGGAPASGISAVVLNVTAAQATAQGFVTVWPTGGTRPTASNINVTSVGQNIPNLVTVAVGAGTNVSMYTQSGSHLVADIAGYYITG